MRWEELTRARADQVVRGVLGLEHTKSGKVRRIPLHPDLLEELRGRVGLLSPFKSVSMFNKAVKRLTGIQTFHSHQLRHTFACRYLEHKGTLAVLQELLGHASIVTTQRYARLREEHVKAEASWVYAGTDKW
jgi:integrase